MPTTGWSREIIAFPPSAERCLHVAGVKETSLHGILLAVAKKAPYFLFILIHIFILLPSSKLDVSVLILIPNFRIQCLVSLQVFTIWIKHIRIYYSYKKIMSRVHQLKFTSLQENKYSTTFHYAPQFITLKGIYNPCLLFIGIENFTIKSIILY